MPQGVWVTKEGVRIPVNQDTMAILDALEQLREEVARLATAILNLTIEGVEEDLTEDGLAAGIEAVRNTNG